MPELPEVEVVRRGLERWVTGRTIAEVQVLHPRAIRRHLAGPADFAAQLVGHRFAAACRRGKYLWLPLDAVGVPDETETEQRPQGTADEYGAASTPSVDAVTEHGARGSTDGAAARTGAGALDGASARTEHGAEHPKPATLDTEHGARSLAPGARSLEHGARSLAPGARSPEHGAEHEAYGADGASDGAVPAGRSVLGHLGMSGQLLVQPESAPDEKHLRIRVRFADATGTELRFVDQRTFGGLSLHDQLPGAPDGLPDVIGHIARDPLDPAFDEAAFYAALRRRRTTIKRALLDQSLISGVGNIYADEALWRARLHYDRPTASLHRSRAAELLGHVRDVMHAALAVGGTSFDSLYVNVNGESGYFERSLDAYGREDEPCRRCGAAMRRSPWMNRSSYFCPRCQRPPRPTAARSAVRGSAA